MVMEQSTEEAGMEYDKQFPALCPHPQHTVHTCAHVHTHPHSHLRTHSHVRLRYLEQSVAALTEGEDQVYDGNDGTYLDFDAQYSLLKASHSHIYFAPSLPRY